MLGDVGSQFCFVLSPLEKQLTAGYSALVQEPSLPPATFFWKNRKLLYAKRPFGKQKALISHLNIAYDNAVYRKL